MPKNYPLSIREITVILAQHAVALDESETISPAGTQVIHAIQELLRLVRGGNLVSAQQAKSPAALRPHPQEKRTPYSAARMGKCRYCQEIVRADKLLAHRAKAHALKRKSAKVVQGGLPSLGKKR